MASPLPSQLRLAAVLPALNESASIAAVVRAIRPFAHAIVVDDGSTDDTGRLAREAGAEVVRHETNRGYDKALETGLWRALELEFDAAVTLDADGQHDPSTLLRFAEAFAEGAELVIGIRDRQQRWSETLFCIVGSALWGIEDPLCGMKGYRTSLLRRAGWFDSYRSIGTELAVRAAKSHVRIAQVPVPTRQRQGASRFGGGLKANWRITRALGLGLLRTQPFAP